MTSIKLPDGTELTLHDWRRWRRTHIIVPVRKEHPTTMVCESETILSSVHWDRPVCDHTWGRFELIVGSNHVCMLSSMHFPFSFVPYRVSKGVNFEVRMLDGNLGMAPHPWLLFDVHQTRIVL